MNTIPQRGTFTSSQTNATYIPTTGVVGLMIYHVFPRAPGVCSMMTHVGTAGTPKIKF